MCSIFGYVSNSGISLKNAIHQMKFGENRGYAGCGIACDIDKKFIIRKCDSRCDKLLKDLEDHHEDSLISKRLIAHTRWPTSSSASEIDSHPHTSENGYITLVHNGIIENAKYLKELYHINTQGKTDSEVAANVLEKCLLESPSDNIEKTIQDVCKSEFKGSYAFAIIIKGKPGIYLIRKGSPLVIGQTSIMDYYLASHTISFPKEVNKIYSLNENECIHIESGITLNNITWQSFIQEDIDINHDTLYEIKEQAKTPHFNKNDIAYTRQLLSWQNLNQNRKVYLIACGTSYHACLYGERQLKKQYQNLKIESWIASEAVYESEVGIKFDENTTCIFISQSGETADTLECLRLAKSRKAFCISLLNTNNSSMERESDIAINIGVGTEFCVASTKAYLGQCAFFNEICEKESPVTKEDIEYLTQDILLKYYKQLANDVLLDVNNIFFIGKLADYIQCKEGSLKMKELTYVPSEAYQSGELKHGPIAMIDDKVAVIAVCTYDTLVNKIKNAIEEVSARGARVIIITKANLYKEFSEYENVVCVTENDKKYQHADLLSVVVMQCLAYYLCKLKGYDDVKPKGIAKCVSVV